MISNESWYEPDNWVILEISRTQENDIPFHKVLAGWSGGYLDDFFEIKC
jgi:hypothetical protein